MRISVFNLKNVPKYFIKTLFIFTLIFIFSKLFYYNRNNANFKIKSPNFFNIINQNNKYNQRYFDTKFKKYSYKSVISGEIGLMQVVASSSSKDLAIDTGELIEETVVAEVVSENVSNESIENELPSNTVKEPETRTKHRYFSIKCSR